MPSSSSLSLREQWNALLAATLETWCHELLYVTRVYPRDATTHTHFLGIQCHANRHPGVVKYIHEALRVAVPALVAGTADELSLLVLKNHFDVVERYVLRTTAVKMKPHQEDEMMSNDHANEADIEAEVVEMEQAMRQLILSVHSLEGYHQTKGSTTLQMGDDATFKIRLRMTSETTRNSSSTVDPVAAPSTTPAGSSSELSKAISDGKWYSPPSDTILQSSDTEDGTSQHQSRIEKVRPLQRVAVPGCGWEMHFALHLYDQ